MHKCITAKQALADRKISIAKCAREIKINQGDLTNALNGKKPMHPKYKKLLSEYLGIDAEVLFPDVERGADGND